MIRRQRAVHAWVWTALAVLLPVAVAVILMLAPGGPPERPPIRLDPPAGGTG